MNSICYLTLPFPIKLNWLFRSFWIYTVVNFFKIFSFFPVCVLKILNILKKKKKINWLFKFKPSIMIPLELKCLLFLFSIYLLFLYLCSSKSCQNAIWLYGPFLVNVFSFVCMFICCFFIQIFFIFSDGFFFFGSHVLSGLPMKMFYKLKILCLF